MGEQHALRVKLSASHHCIVNGLQVLPQHSQRCMVGSLGGLLYKTMPLSGCSQLLMESRLPAAAALPSCTAQTGLVATLKQAGPSQIENTISATSPREGGEFLGRYDQKT